MDRFLHFSRCASAMMCDCYAFAVGVVSPRAPFCYGSPVTASELVRHRYDILHPASTTVSTLNEGNAYSGHCARDASHLDISHELPKYPRTFITKIKVTQLEAIVTWYTRGQCTHRHHVPARRHLDDLYAGVRVRLTLAP